jgi:hypothetical protein
VADPIEGFGLDGAETDFLFFGAEFSLENDAVEPNTVKQSVKAIKYFMKSPIG